MSGKRKGDNVIAKCDLTLLRRGSLTKEQFEAGERFYVLEVPEDGRGDYVVRPYYTHTRYNVSVLGMTNLFELSMPPQEPPQYPNKVAELEARIKQLEDIIFAKAGR